MRKCIFLLVLACIATSLSAQKQPYFGVKTGRTASIWDITGGTVNETRADTTSSGELVAKSLTHSKIGGLSFGLMAGCHMNEWWDIQADVTIGIGPGNYAEETKSGPTWVVNDEGRYIEVIGYDQYEDKFNTVKLGLTTRFQPIRSYRFGFLVGLGTSFNFLTKGREIQTVATATDEFNVSDRQLKLGKSKTDDYDNFDVSIVLNPSLFINLDRDGFLRLILDGKFEWGTRDMFTTERREFLDANGVDVLGSQKWRSTSLTLGLEICFARQR